METDPGVDLIVGCIVDAHFSQRGRHGRLLTAIAHYPQDTGFGIDENTAIIVNKNQLKLIGEGAVTVIDGGAMACTAVPYVRTGESIALADIKLHVLSDGIQIRFKDPPNDYSAAVAAESKTGEC